MLSSQTSKVLLILAENDFDNDNSKDFTLVGCKLSHFWNLSKHYSQNMAFQLELEKHLMMLCQTSVKNHLLKLNAPYNHNKLKC